MAADLLVELRRDGPEPLHRQLEVAIRSRIRDGRLRSGTALPSTRSLAGQLGVSRGVVVEAYQQLTAEGYLTARSGGYTRVAQDLVPLPTPPAWPPADPTPGSSRDDAATGSSAASPTTTSARDDAVAGPARTGTAAGSWRDDAVDGSSATGAAPGSPLDPAWARAASSVSTPSSLPGSGRSAGAVPGLSSGSASARSASGRSGPVPDRPRYDFKYCQPDVSQFPRRAWLRSLRHAVHGATDEQLSYSAGHGAPELRQAVADYLNRARGTLARPEQVVVCSGFTQGVALVARVLAGRGARRVAVEDPSDPEIRQVPVDAGLEVVGVPVDEGGLRVDVLDGIDADALLLTPAHQCPTGAVLSAEARARVLDWARRRGALVVEDDYDSEYRYDRTPVGALQGLAPDLVVYAGSVSKTLSPGLRLGWLVAPEPLVDDLAAAKKTADRGSPILDQLAFADFLARGELDRHMRRMRPVYRRRRDALLAALAEHLPDLRPTGVSAGLHLAAWLPPDLDEATVVAETTARGCKVYGLTSYRLDQTGDPPPRPGLLFGYASLTEPRIEAGITLLAEVVADLRSR
ncbi:MAG TPA: PLP-dependent aminotransferase family protein [Acidimicrobiales bacterium]